MLNYVRTKSRKTSIRRANLIRPRGITRALQRDPEIDLYYFVLYLLYCMLSSLIALRVLNAPAGYSVS